MLELKTDSNVELLHLHVRNKHFRMKIALYSKMFWLQLNSFHLQLHIRYTLLIKTSKWSRIKSIHSRYPIRSLKAILTLSARSPWKICWKRKHANYGNYKWGFYNSFLRMNSCGCRKIKSKNTRFTRESTRKILTSICECIINAHEYSEKNTREW